MTTTDLPVVVDDEMRADLENLAANPPYQLGDIAPGETTYRLAVNPWLPWVIRTGGVSLGATAATIVTICLASPYIWLALATALTSWMVFAWVMAGHDVTEKRPKVFTEAP